jgi:copper chaperone CopZ
VFYLATVAFSSLAAGLLLDYIYVESGSVVRSGMPMMLPVEFKAACTFVLGAVLIAAFFKPSKIGQDIMKGEDGMRYRVLIKGMTCEHCAAAVRRAILESGGVSSAEVDQKKGEAIVSGDNVDMARLRKAIEELGYEFVGSESIE